MVRAIKNEYALTTVQLSSVRGLCKAQRCILTHAGPMVYAAAYCPLSFKATLEEMGFDGAGLHLFWRRRFADGLRLQSSVRGCSQSLWESFDKNPELCYSSSTIAPQSISANMLRRVPINLNRQAEVSRELPDRHRLRLGSVSGLG